MCSAGAGRAHRVAARQALRSRTSGQAALEAARAFGIDNHGGASDAHLALAGALIDRNELADATAALRRLEEILLAKPAARVYQVLLRLEKARVAAALDDFDDVFATLREAGKLIVHLPRSALQHLVDAAAARWHLQAGQARQAEDLITTLPEGSPAHTLLQARLDLARGRFDAVRARLRRASLATMRDRLNGELLLARVAIESGEDAAGARDAGGRARGPRAPGPDLSRRGPGGGSPGPGGRGIARHRVRHRLVGGARLSLPVPQRPAQPTAILTERELSVLRFLPSRLTNAEIARECLVSVNTVKRHLKSIYTKLRVTSRAETVERARLLGLL